MAEKKKFDAIVIGAGPGGYPCAIRLAQHGKKVAIIEKDTVGGVCLNVGCIPSKALIKAASTFEKMQKADGMGFKVKGVEADFKGLQEWKQSVVNKLTGGVGQPSGDDPAAALRGSTASARGHHRAPVAR